MFTTKTEVMALTGYDVSQETVIMAQSIIESYVKRVEADVEDGTDKELLGKAVAYQSAYMSGDEERTFAQISATKISQFGNSVEFSSDGTSPWIAPLAVIACSGLSWKRMRSVKTGSIFSGITTSPNWSTD